MPKNPDNLYGTSFLNPHQWTQTEHSMRRDQTHVLARRAKDQLINNLIEIKPEESPQIWGENPPKHQAFFFEPETSRLIALGSQDAYNPQPTGLQIQLFQNDPGENGYVGRLASFATSSYPTGVGKQEINLLYIFSSQELEDITNLILASSPIAIEKFNQLMEPVLEEMKRQIAPMPSAFLDEIIRDTYANSKNPESQKILQEIQGKK